MRTPLFRSREKRRGLRLWPVGTALVLTFTAALLVSATVFYTGWALMDAHGLKPQRRIDSSTLFDLVKLSFGVVAGAGALVALVVAYRRQRLDEDAALRDATRLHTERFTTAVSQLGDDSAAVRLGGVHALAGLADDAPTQDLRQTCIDVLCAYLRLPYTAEADLSDGDTAARHNYLALREVRHTVIRLIRNHLRLDPDHPHSWQGRDFDLTDVTFDDGDLSGAVFSGGTVDFSRAVFSSGSIDFFGAQFSGATVDFGGAIFSGATVDFRNVVFFGGIVDFSGAKFTGGMVGFRKAIFHGSTVEFVGAEFLGGTVDFAGAEFVSHTVSFFSVHISGGILDFRRAKFSGGTVTFSGSEATGGTVSFRQAWFSGGTVEFLRAGFPGGTIDFRAAKFSGSVVNFRRSGFEGGVVDFSGAKFSDGTVDFSGAEFSDGTVDFRGAEYSGGTVDFTSAVGHAPVAVVPPSSEEPLPTGLRLPSIWYPASA